MTDDTTQDERNDDAQRRSEAPCSIANFGWNYVDVVGDDYNGCINLFFEDDIVALVTNRSLAAKIKFVANRRKQENGQASPAQ